MYTSYLYCKKCKQPFFIPRHNDRKRGKNHIKTMYCPWCKKVTPHIENPKFQLED